MYIASILLILIGSVNAASEPDREIKVTCPTSMHQFKNNKVRAKCTIENTYPKPIYLKPFSDRDCTLDTSSNAYEPIRNSEKREIYFDCEFTNKEYVNKNITLSFGGINASGDLKIVGNITGNISKDCKK